MDKETYVAMRIAMRSVKAANRLLQRVAGYDGRTLLRSDLVTCAALDLGLANEELRDCRTRGFEPPAWLQRKINRVARKLNVAIRGR